MGLQREYGQEWRDEQKSTKYPFCDRCSLTTADNLVIDKEAVYDASFYIVNWNSRLFITGIEISSGTVTEATIYVGSSSSPRAASAVIDVSNIEPLLVFNDTLGRPAGIMVVDPIAMAFIQTWPIGEHMFRENAELIPSAITPMPSSVVSSLRDTNDLIVTEDVWLIGEDGVVLRMEGESIRVDVVGDPLFKRRISPDSFVTPSFIKSINGIQPDDKGDFKIAVGNYLANDTILRIYTDLSLHGLRVELVGQDLQVNVV